jgi:hypothetical protein
LECFIGLASDCAKNPPWMGIGQSLRNVELAHIPRRAQNVKMTWLR